MTCTIQDALPFAQAILRHRKFAAFPPNLTKKQPRFSPLEKTSSFVLEKVQLDEFLRKGYSKKTAQSWVVEPPI